MQKLLLVCSPEGHALETEESKKLTPAMAYDCHLVGATLSWSWRRAAPSWTISSNGSGCQCDASDCLRRDLRLLFFDPSCKEKEATSIAQHSHMWFYAMLYWALGCALLS